MTRYRWGDADTGAPQDRLNAFDRWRATVAEIESEARAELGLGESDGVSRRDLIHEVLRLADPDAVTGRDVVLPGGHTDLVRTWVTARLSGKATTPEERLALARRIAPDPGLNYTFRKKLRRRWDYRSISRFQAAVSKEAAERFGGEPPFPD